MDRSAGATFSVDGDSSDFSGYVQRVVGAIANLSEQLLADPEQQSAMRKQQADDMQQGR